MDYAVIEMPRHLFNIARGIALGNFPGGTEPDHPGYGVAPDAAWEYLKNEFDKQRHLTSDTAVLTISTQALICWDAAFRVTADNQDDEEEGRVSDADYDAIMKILA